MISEIPFLSEPLVLDGQVYPVGVYPVPDHVDFLLGGPLSLRDFLGYDQVKSRVLLDTLNSDSGMHRNQSHLFGLLFKV